MISNKTIVVQRAAVLAGLVALSAPLCAQVNNLVTNDDGSVLYFSSSLRMRGAQQFNHPKLFVVDAQGVRLHIQREQRQLTVPESNSPVSTYYSIEAAAVNGEGSIMGLIARRDCYGGSGCLPVPKYRTEIGGRDFRGRMSLSRTGRFGMIWGDGSMVSTAALIDLSNGERLEWRDSGYALPLYGRRRITSDGAALVTAPSELRLVGMDGSKFRTRVGASAERSHRRRGQGRRLRGISDWRYWTQARSCGPRERRPADFSYHCRSRRGDATLPEQ